MKDKQGKGKLIILILAVIFGVTAGILAADVISLAQMIVAGERVGWQMRNIPAMILILLKIQNIFLRCLQILVCACLSCRLSA